MEVVSDALVYVGGYLFLVFMAVCLATGLYYLAEMVEEYTRLTKRALDYAIKATYGLHALLLIFDRLPFFTLCVSAASQFAYSRMLRRFPFIDFTSGEFLGSLAALAASHWVWVRHFHGSYHSTEYVLGFFFMIVWLVPFGFFISIAANESVLPGGATVPGATANGGNLGGYDPNRGGGKKTRNALLMLLDTLKLYWTRITEKFLPKGGIPGTYRDPGHMKGW